MALPSWKGKCVEDERPPTIVPFAEAKKFFAVDASGSTSGTVMDRQRESTLGLHTSADDFVCKWDWDCYDIQAVDSVPKEYFWGSGGTRPACIFRQRVAVDRIKDSEFWVLLTDGDINDYDVADLARLAETEAVTQVPVILLITGWRSSTPELTNISVGVSFFASAREALILFKDRSTGLLYVLDAKGAFEPLKKHPREEATGWASVARFDDERAFVEHCNALDIGFAQGRGRRANAGVSLGTQWDAATDHVLVKVSDLLEQTEIPARDLTELLAEEAMTQLALTCRIRGQLGQLRDLLIRHRRREVVVQLEDCHGAGAIMERMQAAEAAPEKARLGEELRRAHAANRAAYQRSQQEPSEEARRASEMNRLIDRGLRIMSGFEKASYTADILDRKSNRAMRSEAVSAADSALRLSALDLSGSVGAFRGTCPICCGEEQIMSVVLKKLDAVEENTTDFALNFPLAAAQAKQNADIVSSQCICFQCALLLERSIYQEEITATVPAIDYRGANRGYIDRQLYLALTAGLATGASGVVQLFAAVLDRTLETKRWCSPDAVDDPEVLARRQVLAWSLRNLLERCPCREDFAETGAWVEYPRALRWATEDYGRAGLDSWIIQYPLAGFSQLMRWYDILDMGLAEAVLPAIRRAKLLHAITARLMDDFLRGGAGDRAWTHPWLELIYRAFNAPGIPRDLSGPTSLVPRDDFWGKLQAALGPRADVERFLGLFDPRARSQDLADRVQMIIFWAVYTQKGHAMPKRFFANVRLSEPLAARILDPTAALPPRAVADALLSIFCPARGPIAAAHATGPLPPFVSPYGPSVLRCGKPRCGVRFHDDADVGQASMQDAIRKGRARHLAEVYGASPTFASQTGLPERTLAPAAPSSSHITLHISTARTWARLDRQGRQAVAAAVEQGPGDGTRARALHGFLGDVRREICAASQRGNIYSATIEAEVRELLPGFLVALRTAGRVLGAGDASAEAFEHDWTQNTFVWKMEYELRMGGEGS